MADIYSLHKNSQYVAFKNQGLTKDTRNKSINNKNLIVSTVAPTVVGATSGLIYSIKKNPAMKVESTIYAGILGAGIWNLAQDISNLITNKDPENTKKTKVKLAAYPIIGAIGSVFICMGTPIFNKNMRFLQGMGEAILIASGLELFAKTFSSPKSSNT